MGINTTGSCAITSPLMIAAETVSEILSIDSIFTQLITEEDFIAFSRHESFKF